MKAQGCIVKDVYVYQDNQSALLLETNGMKFTGKYPRHIRIKDFSITNRVKDNKLKIIYCPTKEMVVDFFTKPLQGMLFITHRNTVLRISQYDMPLNREEYKTYIAQRINATTT